MLEFINIEIEYIILGLVGFNFILFLLILILYIKNSKLKKKYKAFISGKEPKSLEEEIIKRFQEIDRLKSDNKKMSNKIELITENLSITYQKMAIVKYDAFKEMGGKLSFALALLNDKNDGFIINSMHSTREGCYSYIKEIKNGESFVTLAEEERMALEQAKNNNRIDQ